jgi:hypothetical protein
MENNQEININLEKMIKKMNKIAKEKNIILRKRSDRKLNIKVKKFQPKIHEDNDSTIL